MIRTKYKEILKMSILYQFGAIQGNCQIIFCLFQHYLEIQKQERIYIKWLLGYLIVNDIYKKLCINCRQSKIKISLANHN